MRQSEILEQRSTASKLGLLPREDLQQVQTQRPAHVLPPQPPARTTSASEPQRSHLGDVKLFGQSLLSQPPPNTGQASISSSQKLRQPVTAMSAGFVPMPTSNLANVYGNDPSLVPSSAFTRAGSTPSGEGHAQSWPAASTGNLDLFNSMIGGLPGVVLYKNEDNAKPELSSVQDAVARMTARLTREAHEKDVEDTGMQQNLEHVESAGAQDLKAKEVVVGDVARGKDLLELSTDIGRERARMEVEWRNDSRQPINTGSVDAFTRPTHQSMFEIISKATVNQNSK